ncbi:MAG: TraR/DksA C4-type zinc finger protein [bacterium]|nr:TraR/DksA C4-type zinc finger protein [bacterium]
MEKAKKAQMEKFKTVLMEKRARILGDVQQLERQTLLNNQRDSSGDLADYSFHMADVGSDAAERETMLGLVSSQQKMLEPIKKALERIDQGVYGTCELCGSDIAKERLDALPEAIVCMKCMTKYNL